MTEPTRTSARAKVFAMYLQPRALTISFSNRVPLNSEAKPSGRMVRADSLEMWVPVPSSYGISTSPYFLPSSVRILMRINVSSYEADELSTRSTCRYKMIAGALRLGSHLEFFWSDGWRLRSTTNRWNETNDER